jgi:predicted phosphodiesterase
MACVKAFGIKHGQNHIPPHVIIEAKDEKDITDSLIKQKTLKIIDLEDDTSILEKKVSALESAHAGMMANLNILTKAHVRAGVGTTIKLEVPVVKESARSGHLFLSDFHVGKLIECDGNRFNIHVAYQRAGDLVSKVCEHVKRFDLKSLTIHMMGDMVDGPAGTMHADQQTHQDVHFDAQVTTAGELMAAIVYAIQEETNIVGQVYCIGGNHGRFTKDRQDSPVRMADNLAYRIMSITLRKDCDMPITIVSKDNYYVCTNQKTSFVVHHGDKMPRNPLGALFEIVSANPEMWGNDVVWIHGHTHTPHFEHLQSNVSLLKTGSFCGPDEYALRLGKGSRANQTLVVLDEDGKLETPIFINL